MLDKLHNLCVDALTAIFKWYYNVRLMLVIAPQGLEIGEKLL